MSLLRCSLSSAGGGREGDTSSQAGSCWFVMFGAVLMILCRAFFLFLDLVCEDTHNGAAVDGQLELL